MVNHEDMIRYIKCTLESASQSQIEEVFCEAQSVLEMDDLENANAIQMVEAILTELMIAEPRQIEDIYWSVLSNCD